MRKEVRQTPNEILEEKIDKLQRSREWKHFLVECVVLAAAIYVLFHYIIGIAFVSGSSMEPSLKDGELVVFYRLDQGYRENDIVIIHREGNLEYIKRIVAAGGDTVELSDEGKLLVNGVPEASGTVFTETRATSENVTFPYEVPKGCYFVLGDNRVNSKDSRIFGAVPEAEITGRVFFHLGIAQ